MREGERSASAAARQIFKFQGTKYDKNDTLFVLQRCVVAEALTLSIGRIHVGVEEVSPFQAVERANRKVSHVSDAAKRSILVFLL